MKRESSLLEIGEAFLKVNNEKKMILFQELGTWWDRGLEETSGVKTRKWGGGAGEEEKVAGFKYLAIFRLEGPADDGDNRELVGGIFKEVVGGEVELIDLEKGAGGEGLAVGGVHLGLEVVEVDGLK